MKIEVSPLSAAYGLADFLRRCECTVAVDGGILDVSPPEGSQTPRQARIEIGAYIRVWSALNPSVDVTLERDDSA